MPDAIFPPAFPDDLGELATIPDLTRRHSTILHHPRPFVSVSRPADIRVTFKQSVIIYAHFACGLPIPSQPILRARAEAMAYYTNDPLDATDTALAMLAQAIDYPASLVAARDLPRELPNDLTSCFIGSLYSMLSGEEQAAGTRLPIHLKAL